MRRSHNNNESAYARVRQDYAAAVACNVLGISSTVLVPVQPRMDLNNYGTLGLVQFASSSDRAINAHATRQFQERDLGLLHRAQPIGRAVHVFSVLLMLAALGWGAWLLRGQYRNRAAH